MDNQLPKQKTSDCVYIRIMVQMSKCFCYEGSWGGGGGLQQQEIYQMLLLWGWA